MTEIDDMPAERHEKTQQTERPASTSEADATFPKGNAAPARRALNGAGYTELRQLAGVPVAALKRLHGMGPTALARLQEALEREGLSLG